MPNAVERMRKVEGVETLTVHNTHLTKAGRGVVDQIIDTRRHVKLGVAGTIYGLMEHSSHPGQMWAFMGGYAALHSLWVGPKLPSHFRDLADLHDQKELFHETNNRAIMDRLRQFGPTHLGVDGAGNVVFIKQSSQQNWFQRFLSWQPFKSIRTRLFSNEASSKGLFLEDKNPTNRFLHEQDRKVA